MQVVLGLVIVIAVLLLAAALYDLRARRRGTYRGPSEWREVTSRRRDVKREIRKKKDPRQR